MTDRPSFRLYFWPHRALYLGHSPKHNPHRHHAAQICVSLGRPLRFRTDGVSHWSVAQAVLIPPHSLHQLDSGEAPILALYLEPESDDYPISKATMGVRSLPLRKAQFDRLRALHAGGVGVAAAWEVCAAVLGVSGQSKDYRLERDARIRLLVEEIRSHPGRVFTAEKLAEMVNLSPSRMSHLFKAQVGVPVRQFVIWSRLRVVIEQALRGSTLTAAAHDAGFADAAHMSRAFRQMFGFPPSSLFSARVSDQVSIMNS